MGLFSRTKKVEAHKGVHDWAQLVEMANIKPTGKGKQAVVGESNYQQAIIAAAGGVNEAGQPLHRDVLALIEPDPLNQHDKTALVVLVDGKTVGYIPKTHKSYVKKVMKQQDAKYLTCVGHITGRAGTSRKDAYFLGVELDLGRKTDD
jgi:hypothetical protein